MKMIHKPRNSASADMAFNGLPVDEIRTREAESHQQIPESHNGHDLWKEIRDALSEKDIMELRDLLGKLATQVNPEQTGSAASFDLSCPADLHEPDELRAGEEPEVTDFNEPLPRIHIHHHRRVASENTHYFYREQEKASSPEASGMDEEVADETWLTLESAMKENDVISLRDKLAQIGKNVSSHPFTTEEIENYLDGNMSPSGMALLEEELMHSGELRADVDLSLEVEKAAMETDVMALREAIGQVIRRENSSSRDLAEIEAFLDEDMDDATRSGFVDELQESRDLKAELELVREVGYALSEKDIMSLRDSLQGIAVKSGKQVRKTVLPVSGKARLAAVAALFLLLIGITPLMKFNATGSRDLYDAYFSAPRAPSVFRSADQQVERGLNEGLKSYSKGHYHTALLYFGEALQGEKENPAARFYAGASYMQLKQFSSAVSAYDKVILHHDNFFVEQAEWYTALCYVRMEDYARAGDQLGSVVSRGGFYREEASSLLKKIWKAGNLHQ